ncbi:hypothetical protein TSTA_107310 [Talaromyces stipitatus ATCC 10500]|uniref:Uncharacterized protein n=1 Tax=Talaromyces stipitatus (strain ATCC 10500 / CBS 375.48 / QM 6759 / NRRL 1006) TaxID=441959 RepID=B8MN75_TALSN|nr:uncharacterized protein TSTA_107310 [Talaromyces stipitatus ATCC 10500]EED14524.1 hypothetical protein TSTA_107310 [Talaromyces stipitatus ATCC 10500]
MAITLDEIRFYRPHSLPARPTKSLNHQPTSFPHHASKTPQFTSLTPAKTLFPLLPQPVLPHPLPPRPPTIISSDRHAESKALQFPTTTPHTAQSHPAHENDFDRVLHDFFSYNGKSEDDGQSSMCISQQDNRDEDCGQATSPDPDVASHTTDILPSPSFTVQASLEIPVNEPVQPVARNESHPQNETNEIASATFGDSPLASCTAESAASMSNELNTESIDVTTPDSAQHSSVTNGQQMEIPHANEVQNHTPEAGGSTAISEDTELQGDTGDSKRANSNELRESAKRKRSPSACLSYPPAPLVVVPVPSGPVSLRRKSTRLSTQLTSDHLRYSDSINGDSRGSDSAPSDNENDADYSNSCKIRTTVKSSRPSKRPRRVLDKASSASQVPRQSFSESPSVKLPESPPEDFSAESEPTPIQGHLRLRYIQSNIVYCVEFSQTALLSSIAASQTEPTQPHQQADHLSAKIPYTPKEEAYIKDLKAQELGWHKIETLFAQRFPYRKASC